jgi:hypothetical protein
MTQMGRIYADFFKNLGRFNELLNTPNLRQVSNLTQVILNLMQVNLLISNCLRFDNYVSIQKNP